MNWTLGTSIIVAGILVTLLSAVYSLAVDGEWSTAGTGVLMAGGFVSALLYVSYDVSRVVGHSLIGVSVLAMATSVVLVLART